MLTFKQFLEEDSYRGTGGAKARTQVVGVEDFIRWADNNASVYLNGPHFLYRGGSGDRQKGLRLGNPAAEGVRPRVSANTVNNYTLWIDNHPSFKGWAKRSLSFIGTDDRDVAEGFGGASLLIIHDEAKIGVVGNGDLWDTDLGVGDVTIEELNGFTQNLFDESGDAYPKSYDEMVGVMKKWDFKKMEEELSKDMTWSVTQNMLKLMEKKRLRNLYELWEELVKPSIFAANTTGARVGDKATDGEVWIQGEVGFIPHIKRIPKEDAERLAEWADQYPELLAELHDHWGREFEDYYGGD